jgi:excisionase family DNA binding protein
MRLLTPEAVAEQLAVSRSTVLRMIQDKVIPVVCLRKGKRKGVYRVRQEVLDKWIINRERQGIGDHPPTPSATNPLPRNIKPANGQAPDS